MIQLAYRLNKLFINIKEIIKKDYTSNNSFCARDMVNFITPS